MTEISRRDALKLAAAGVAAGTLGAPALAEAQPALKTEANASLRVLRWKRFVQGDEDLWMKNTEKFSKTTGVKVRVDHVNWEEVRPKAAVAANVGAGPDVVVGWMDDPHLYPEKLVDLTDVATYLGKKYGGWFPTAEKYGSKNGRWIGLPLGASGALVNYRTSWMKEAGFEKFPTDTAGFLKLCQGLKKIGHPAGFALSHATGDSETWLHCLLWGHGGRLVDEENNVAINSRETIAAIEYVKELSESFIEGVAAWSGVSNNNAFLESKIGLTSNGISIYYVTKGSDRADYKAVGADMNHAPMPVGPVGRPTELHLLSQAMVFRYSKYPNAAKEYLRFMWEKEQYEPWQQASLGYVSHPLKGYDSNPIWTSDPKIEPFRGCVERMLPHGYAGSLGYASAACLADWIVVDMFAQAATGQMTPKDAAAEAERRANRYYKV